MGWSGMLPAQGEGEAGATPSPAAHLPTLGPQRTPRRSSSVASLGVNVAIKPDPPSEKVEGGR